LPFIYTPSLYGFAGALIFLILALISLNAEEWMETATWGLLGAAYLLKHLPKLLVFRMLNLAALALLVLGLALFLIENLPKIS
jgi:predicted CDP-diglyceride synthetase/phosphatidate cytidylyltransferase